MINAYIAKGLLRKIDRASMPTIRHLTHVVPEALKNPHAIFEGFRYVRRRPPIPDQAGFTYVYRPGTVYYDEVHGHARNARDDEIFLVLLDGNFVLLDWALDRKTEQVNGELLPKYAPLRFVRRLL